MNSTDQIQEIIHSYILEAVLPGEDPGQLKNDTPLITTGVLDSIATLKLVAFLEERFKVSIAAHEANSEYLNTVEAIADLVRSKLS